MARAGKRARRLLTIVWAAPATLVGLALAAPALPLGARLRLAAGAIEVGGGRLPGWMARVPKTSRFGAITFGHVILGTDHATLDALRAHEQAHVRRYERWGVFFFPLYAGSSLIQLLRGRDPYAHNRFEREACVAAAAGGPPSGERGRRERAR